MNVAPSSAPARPWRRRRLVLVIAGLAISGAGIIVWYFLPLTTLAGAERALQSCDFAVARSSLDRYRARRPGDTRACLLAVQAARRSGAYADAERLLNQFEAAHSATDGSRLEWLLLGAQQGDLSTTEGPLESLVGRGHAEAVLILEVLARGYIFTRRWSDATDALDRLAARDPAHAPMLVLRASVHEHRHDPAAALADYRRAVDIAPAFAEARLGLATALNGQGYTREAVYHYEILRERQPIDPDVLLSLARALADAAELDEAEQRLDELLAAHPDHVDGLVDRGRLALRRGRLGIAEPHLARAVRLAPWHREGQQFLHRCLTELGRTGEAATCAARLAELQAADAALGRFSLRFRDTQDTGIRHDVGTWFLRNGQAPMGVGWMMSILRIDPRHAGAHAALADYYDRSGQPRRAAEHRAAASGRG